MKIHSSALAGAVSCWRCVYVRGKPPVSRGSAWFALGSVTGPIARTASWALQSRAPCPKPWCGGGRAVSPRMGLGTNGDQLGVWLMATCFKTVVEMLFWLWALDEHKAKSIPKRGRAEQGLRSLWGARLSPCCGVTGSYSCWQNIRCP